MRCSKYMILLAGLVLLVPLSAFARSKNERSVDIPKTVQIGQTQLKAGTYKVEWQENGSSLHVNFLENGKTVASAQGKMVQLKTPSTYDEVVMNTKGKTNRLEEIHFGGKKEALVFASNQTAMT
jgi:hypothetical protein